MWPRTQEYRLDVILTLDFVANAIWLDLSRAPDGGVAAEVDIALLLNVVCAQGVQRVDVGVVCGVCVPGAGPAIPVRVNEGDRTREVVVVLDDVGEICERLAAFIAGRVKGCARVVDGVDVGNPLQELVNPCSVLGG